MFFEHWAAKLNYPKKTHFYVWVAAVFSIFMSKITDPQTLSLMKKLFYLIILFTNFTFAQIPANYYTNTENLSGSELQAMLHEIIDNHTVVSYSALWNAFYTTDSKSNNKVWDIYSDVPGGTPAYEFTFSSNQCGNYSHEGDCYNREHSFPTSWFNDQSPMNSDLFQIYPTDGYVNQKRGNYPYGVTNNASWTSTNGSKLGPCSTSGYSGTIFEPIDEYKGDIARTYFYMATRYFGEDAGWPGSPMFDGAQPKEWALNMLLIWHQNDPVSVKEIDRNNAIYQLQNNRNPFIDHPEFANYIWDGDEPQLSTMPSNHVVNFSTSFINLSWTDAIGTNLPDGYLIQLSEIGYNSIPQPQNGIAANNYTNAKVVPYGVENCTFTGLKSNTDYYFKIYSFTGQGSNTIYKLDGNAPQLIINSK